MYLITYTTQSTQLLRNRVELVGCGSSQSLLLPPNP